MKSSALKSQISLKDRNGCHRRICLFCGKIVAWKQKALPTACDCDAYTQLIELRKKGNFEEVNSFISQNIKWFVVFTGKHGEHITSNKKEYDALMALKQARSEENERILKERHEEIERNHRIWAEKREAEEKLRRELESKRLVNSFKTLRDSTLEELITGLIQIVDDMNCESFKGCVTYEELKGYIQDNFNSLVEDEIARREREAYLDD